MSTGPLTDAEAGTPARDRKASDNSIVDLSATPSERLGLFKCRQQRTPGEICAAITNAFAKEARLVHETSLNVAPPQVLVDIAAWVARGCLLSSNADAQSNESTSLPRGQGITARTPNNRQNGNR